MRALKNQNFIPNEVIAQLNDMAYKAIKKGSLNKLVDARAVKNEDLYKKLDARRKEIIYKLDFKTLEDKHKDLVEQIGDCPFSVMNTFDAMKEGDCMCIGLRV